MAKLLYGFLVKSNNSWFRSLLPRDMVSKERNPILGVLCGLSPNILTQHTLFNPPPFILVLFLPSSAGSGPPQYYVSLSQSQQPKSVTTFVKYILANMTGTATSLNQSQCQNPKDISGESRDVCLLSSQMNALVD